MQDDAEKRDGPDNRVNSRNVPKPYIDRFEFVFEKRKIAKESQEKAYSLSLIEKSLEDEERYLKATYKLEFRDSYGGLITIDYQMNPILDQIQARLALTIASVIKKAINIQISKNNLSPDEEADMVRMKGNQGNHMLRFYIESAINHFMHTFSRSLRDAIDNHLDESVIRCRHDWSGLPFEGEKGQAIAMIIGNWPKAVEKIVKDQVNKTRKRIGAPSHGGKQRKRKLLVTIDEQFRFASFVRDLEKPSRGNKSLWAYILDEMKSNNYSAECLKRLEQDKNLSEVPRNLLREACIKRKPYFSKAQNIPRKYSPQAFTLKHAYTKATGESSGIDEHPSFERLRKLLPEAKAKLEIIEKRSEEGHVEPSRHFKLFHNEKGKIEVTETQFSTGEQARIIFELPNGQVISAEVIMPSI